MKCFDAEKNRQERLKFVEFREDYVKTHSDMEWSKQQAVIINSEIQNARWFYKRSMAIQNKKIGKFLDEFQKN